MVKLKEDDYKEIGLEDLVFRLHLLEKSIFIIFSFWMLINFSFVMIFLKSYDLDKINLIYLFITIFPIFLFFFIIISAKSLFSTIMFINNPFHMFKEYKTFVPNFELIDKIKNIAYEEGVDPPKLLFIDENIPIGSFGFGRESAVLIIPYKIIEYLDQKELEAVLRHEFYHIKNDIKKNLFEFFWIKLNFPSSISVFSYIFIPIVAMIYFISYTRLPKLQLLLSHLSSSTISLNLNLGYILYGSWLFVMLIIFIYVFYGLGFYKDGDISVRFLYLREFLADAHNILKTKEIESLFSAIGKMIPFIGLYSSNVLRKKYLSDPNNLFSTKISFEDFIRELTAFNPLKLMIRDRLLFRLTLLQLLERLIHERVRIDVLIPIDEAVSKRDYGLPEPAYSILQKNKSRLEEFSIHLKKENGFNLMKCASAMKMEPFDVFVIFAFLINLDSIKIVE